MGEPFPRRLVRGCFAALGLLLISLPLAGCSSNERAASPRLIGFETVIRDTGHNFTGESRLLTLDRETLRPHGRSLSLRDYSGAEFWSAATSYTGQLSPDRRTLAVGGSTGEVILVDPDRLRRIGTIRIRRSDDLPVAVDSWPRPNRLFAILGTIRRGNTTSDSLAIVDPIRRRVIATHRLAGGVWFAAKAADGTLALLVSPLTSQMPRTRLLIVSPDGRLHWVQLPEHPFRARGIKLDGQYFPPGRGWTMTTDGHRRAFLAEAGEPVLEIDLHTLAVRRHEMGLRPSGKALPTPPARETGNADPSFSFSRSLSWLGGDRLAISGATGWPTPLGAARIGVRFTQSSLAIVNTRTWRVVKRLPLTSCRSAFSLYLCSEAVGGFPPDGKGSRGSTLIAYDHRWKRLYRNPSASLWWDDVNGRLIAGRSDGSVLWQLNPRTGTRIRRVAGDLRIWPLELVDWHPATS